MATGAPAAVAATLMHVREPGRSTLVVLGTSAVIITRGPSILRASRGSA